MLNIQAGFTEEMDEWKCTECGFVNEINEENLYLTEDEYQADLQNPYKGLSDEEVIKLMSYEEVEQISKKGNVSVVKNDDGEIFVRKYLKFYDKTVYEYLMQHPVSHMPRIIEVCESDNCLIVIEEFICGKTLEEILSTESFDVASAAAIVLKLAYILRDLHNIKPPIIHRDVKPANIIMDGEEVVLLDMNAAKWVKDEAQDTNLIGSMYYAAPEQFGYGFSASDIKTDIYALGILLNVLITGKLPKEDKATGDIWSLIEGCIRLEPAERCSEAELIERLNTIIKCY